MQLTPEILKERKTGIGGSDCAAVLRLSKWSTPLDIYLSKINPNSKIKENEYMEWGHRLEPVVLEKYKEFMNVEIKTPNHIFKNNKYPWMLANVDGLSGSPNINTIVEVKTTRAFNEDWGVQGTDEIPQEYLIQVAHYCAVLDMEYADIAALGGGSEFRLYHYRRNKELEQQIIDKTHDFWHNNVLKQIPPEPINNNDIIKLYQHGDESKTLLATDDIEGLAHQHKTLKEEAKKLKERQDFIELELKVAMKDNVYLVDAIGTKLLSWKNQSSTRLDTKTFKIAHADLYQQISKESESRVLRNHIK
jgi:putative phage-type endonuclease